MKKQAVNSKQAPAALGPYSHAILAGETLYVSGQLGLDPESGVLAVGIEAQTKKAFSNLSAILETAEMTRENIVKTTIFLRSISDFSAVNAIYAEYFKEVEVFPARSCVEVSALPKWALFEIEAIAVK